MGHEGHRTRPADILIPHWDLGRPAALDLTVTSTLNSSTLGVTSGSAVLAAEVRKHNANDAKCSPRLMQGPLGRDREAKRAAANCCSIEQFLPQRTKKSIVDAYEMIEGIRNFYKLERQ